MSDNIKVVVKVRPLIRREIEDKLTYQWRVKNNTLYQIDHNSRDVIKSSSYTFDKVYDQCTNTSDVYNDVAKPIVQAAIKGFNGTIFAYGQTSSGKTFTMTGTDEHPGIIPLAVRDLFETIKNIPDRDFLISVSYIEIYNETLQDLLSSNQEKKIKIQETFDGVKVDVQGKLTSSPDEVLELMNTTIESREHVEKDDEEEEAEVACVNVSVLNLVDLAGSERAGQTGATGQRFVEGTYINKSLSTLAGVIRQLSEESKSNNKYVNFRDSKLTRILQNSLGGNAKTSIICAVTPAAVEETVSTLQFANRAKAIKNTPQVVVRSTNDSMIQGLTRQLGKLQSELVNKKNIEEDNVKLQRKIAELQQLIINGFSHRPGRRSKPPPQRRATISTLPSTEEHTDTKPSLQKYCTPVLKYNPLLIPGAPDFRPASSKPSLNPVPEESTTTPSPKKRVEFMDKVVEIIDSTKTPPCILRKQAKQIEKDYKDLQQMTELEKMYPPDVVELIKKLNENKTEMCRMEEEINRLNNQSKQKDFEKSLLESKINETEEVMKQISIQKISLETKCNEFQTKLTDIEVTYDILKNKSKNREEELLDLLEENKNKKTPKIGVPQVALCEKELSQFMNISKDISLVKSDHECSIINPNKETIKFEQDLTSNVVQDRSYIEELEANIIKQKQKIETLENNAKEQIKLIDNLREQLAESDKENLNLKNSIESLNFIIKNQEETIELNHKDIVSCNDVIKDLQMKLASKEYLPNMNLDDDVIEGLIANEDKLIANNENMLNIIHSLKKTIDNRNKEISNFKIELKQLSEKLRGDSEITEQIETRDTQISLLTSQLEQLKSKETQNITTIDELLNEKQSWTVMETELKEKINHIQCQITAAKELSKANEDIIVELNEQKHNLNKIIEEKDESETELKDKIVQLLTQLKDSTSVVEKLRSTLEEKNDLICSLQDQKSPILSKTQSIVYVLNNIILVLTGNRQEVPDFGNLDDALQYLHDLLLTTETTVKEVLLRNTDLSNQNLELQSHINTLTKEQQNVLSEIDNLNVINDNLSKTNKDMQEENLNLTEKIIELTKQYEEADIKIKEMTAKCLKSQEDLAKSAQALESMYIKHLNIIKEKEEEIAHKSKELNNLTEEQKEILENISAKIMDSVRHLNLELQTCNYIQNSYPKIMDLLQVLYDNIASETDSKTQSDCSPNINTTFEIRALLDQIQQENKILNEDLTQRSQNLEQLHNELKIKSTEIKNLESKVKTWKTEFENLQDIMQKQLHDLNQDNLKLKERGYGVNFDDNSSSQITSDSGESLMCSNPLSLTTLSLNIMQHIMNSNLSEISSEDNIPRNDEHANNTSNVGCQCPDLTQELEKVKTENITLMDVVQHLKSVNLQLLDEREAMSREVDLIIEPSKELQKKIANHKTTLSTLTATTYAEHQLLKSKLTALQHHHSRFHNICLRDLPSLKEPLEKLMTILKAEIPQDASHENQNSLDNNCSTTNLKNESCLDPDVLMFDTNLTINTNNTLIGHDQTCLVDITQVQLLDSDLSVVGQNMSILKSDLETQKIQPENDSEDKIRLQKLCIDAQCSPIKTTDDNIQELELIKQELVSLKDDFKEQLDMYVEKINNLEQENGTKSSEIYTLKVGLNNKNSLLKELQNENDSLSTQIMDNITEIDNLKAELDKWKQLNENLELSLKNAKETVKQDSISRRRSSEHSPLNRSLSDSDSVSSYNKMCTLQNEICAVKEGCKQLTHEVTAIQNHLEQGDLSTMSLDDCIKLDIYASEKLKCLKYYAEKTDSEPDDFNNDMSLVEIMKLFYEKIVLKQSNETENLVNQLKVLQETKDALQNQISSVDADLLNQRNKINTIQKLFTQIKCNIDTINNKVSGKQSFKNNVELLTMYKDNVLEILDTELEISSSKTFDCIVDSIVRHHENELLTLSKFTELQEKVRLLIVENNDVNKNLDEMKQKMDLREGEYNLLKLQKEKIHEISNAVTLNIIQKEKELNQAILRGLEKLIQSNKSIPDTFNPDLPADKNLDVIFDYFLEQHNNSDRDNFIIDLKESRSIIADKEIEINNLKTQIEKLTTINEKLNVEATNNIAKIETQNSIYEELKRIYHGKVDENDANIQLIANLSEECGLLKETISQNEVMLQELHSKLLKHSVCESCVQKDDFITELSTNVTMLNRELETLKQANEIINKEKETLDNELEKALIIISKNKIDIDKMNTDILVLRESTKDNVMEILNLKDEAKSLLALNAKLKMQFEEKQKDCVRLDINIKTHEKTAEIQSKIIMRLQTQKDQDDATIREKDKNLDELCQKLEGLQADLVVANSNLTAANKEIEVLKRTKTELEHRISELEMYGDSNIARSPTAAASDVRQRRQSLADSRRTFSEATEQKLEDLFMSRAKPDDLFIDAEDSSNRSTPAQLANRKSDGRNHSRLDQSDKESDGSRPSSVTAARKQRRQSSHDLHRTLPYQRPPSSLFDESKHSDTSNRSSNNDDDTSQLKERIAAYLQEIEQLKERNRELDDECETCAAYLRERDEQCGRLKKEKAALENVISDLKEKLKTSSALTQHHSHSENRLETVDASVNTDEDWANLHSVVVDRMSYDAVVEKNKRLVKTTEQLRIKKQEMRNTIAKLQHALEENATRNHSSEIEELKSELKAVKQELCEVKERNRELDEECDTCAAYLRERDEQCRKLKQAKSALEAKLEEVESSHKLAMSLRKKRQSFHDQNRPDTSRLDDASTHTDDILSYHVERDCPTDTEEVKQLRKTVQTLSQQLSTVSAAATQQVYVATGSAIVQNQQITDVMKENQKLKLMNAKLIKLCKKRGKSQTDANRENEEPTQQYSNVQS